MCAIRWSAYPRSVRKELDVRSVCNRWLSFLQYGVGAARYEVREALRRPIIISTAASLSNTLPYARQSLKHFTPLMNFLTPPLLPNLELSLGTRDTKHILAVVAGLISYTPLDRRIKVPHFERQLCYSRALKSIVTWSCPHFWVWSVPNAKNYRRPPSLLRRLSSARAIYTMVPQLVAIEANPRLP